MKIVLKRRTQFETVLSKNDPVEAYAKSYSTIESVLADPTADKEEKARTVIYSYPSFAIPSRSFTDVFVFDDDGALVFSGEVNDDI